MSQDVKPRKIWRVVLVGSLALNLLTVGVVGGSFLRGGGESPRGFEFQLGPLSEALDREDRRKIGNRIRREIRRSGLSGGPRRAAFEQMIVAVEAQPFDPEALTEIIIVHQTRTDGIRAAALGTFATYLSEMTVEERLLFAQNLRLTLERSQKRDGQRPPPPNSGG